MNVKAANSCSVSSPSSSIFLIPFPLPTRLVPLVCLALFQFWCGIQLHTLIGFAVGYLFCFIPALTFTTPMLRLCEVHALRRRSSFVCVDRAGLAQPWEHFVQDATEREFGVANSPQTLTSSPGNLSRSAFPVNRGERARSRNTQSRTTQHLRGEATSCCHPAPHHLSPRVCLSLLSCSHAIGRCSLAPFG